MRKIYLALLLLTTGLLLTGKSYAQPAITYTAVVPSCLGGDVVLSGVSITDAAGVPIAGALVPRLYVRKNSGAWFSTPGTLASGSATSGTWDFSMTAATLGGLSTGNNVAYFIIAQNTGSLIAANPGTGLVATDVNTVVTYPTSPNTYSVIARPILSALNIAPATTCIGQSVTLASGTVTGTGSVVSYNWSGPNGYSTTTGSSPTTFTPMVLAAAGVYSLSVTYTGSGCTSNIRTRALAVNAAMPPITGTTDVCVGATTPLSIATTGGAWSSSNTGTATVSTSGVVTGVVAGNATITYLKGTCYVTTVVSVSPLPAAIAGASNVCVGGTTLLTNADAGGAWSSSNIGAATVSGGLVSGVAAGTANISYTLPTGCVRTLMVTVNVVPTAITGTLVVCEASTTSLASTPGSGTWSSGNTSVATVGLNSGSVTGVAMGTAAITYTIGSGGGCITIATVNVNPRPLPITGAAVVCVGATTALGNLTPSGTWSSGNPSFASVSTGGVVTGITPAIAIISYTLATGCARTIAVTVNATPGPLSAPLTLCEGTSVTLTSSGGTWSSSDVVVAPVSSSGVVTAASVGTAVISYVFPTGCFRANIVTVTATPPAIGGTPIVCSGGGTTTLSNGMSGGVWSALSGSTFTINPTTGVVTGGVASGSASVRYTLSSGCFATIQVTTVPTPAILGSNVICEGGSITMTSGVAGGLWSSSNPPVASVTSGSGVVLGIMGGTTNIVYTTAAGCSNSKTVTVNPNPTAITGTFIICQGTTTTLSNLTPGGSWYSAASGIASVNNITGIVTANTAGTALISYRLSTGCSSSVIFTVNPLPAAIAGNASMCVGTTTPYVSVTPGGTWSSSNAAVASVDIAGVVSALSAGTSIIYYTSTSGCMTTKIVSVNALPAPIGGPSTACTGSITALTNATLGGTWLSGNTTLATVNSAGYVTGVSGGVVDITYTIPNTCRAVKTITVFTSPLPITGSLVACVGSTSLLSDATPGGTWNSGNPTVASIDVTGLVSANAQGVSTISYTDGNGCKASALFNVNSIPNPIGGNAMICTGSSTTLSSLPAGGSWTSSDPFVSVATTTGVVTGIGAGTATVYYTLTSGCARSVVVTVNQTPTASTGTPNTCIGSSSTLNNAAYPGGTWTSSNAAVATAGVATGVITGVTTGNVNVTYTLSTGCRTITPFVVNPLPAAITGLTNICQGQSTTLSNATLFGTWSSSNITVATIGSGAGIAVGVNPGFTNISYTLVSTGCSRVVTLNVFPVPAAITGTTQVCAGSATTLSSTTLGGTWTSSGPTVATVGATSGIVTGVSTGIVNITYRMSSGCQVSTPVTVNMLPAALVGSSSVCVGATTVYTSTTPNGLWSSSNNPVAQVGTNGVVTGISTGAAFISYMLPTGCFVVRPITVNNLPSPIAGTLAVCQGSTTSLSSLTPGGTWNSSNPAFATVGFTSGTVTGLFPGTTDIAYTVTGGCSRMVTVTVNPLPTAISGVANLCLGSTSTLSSLTTGGTWSTGNPLVATVITSGPGTGDVTGITLGTAPITYSLGTGCRTILNVTVSAIPAAILGVPAVCVGSTTNLSNTTLFGTWSSTDNSIATVSATGVVNGITTGIVTISYTLGTGCARAISVTVNQVPTPIAEVAAVCVANNMTLTSLPMGGIWTSSLPSRATIDVATGLLTGVNAGTSTITYTLPTGCKTYTIATVNANPSAIMGVANICAGSSVTLTNTVPGGIWSSDDMLKTYIDPSTGELTGVGVGIDVVRYTLTGGCQASITVTVTPAPDPIAGDLDICAGQLTALTNPQVGGTWSSSTPAVATIDMGSGVVTSYIAGSTAITYTMGIGCKVVTTVVVNPAPSPITGPTEVCMGHSVALYNAVAGGAWISSDGSVASVDIATGVVTGIANNTVTINYTLPGGCAATFLMTVHSTPPPIGGSSSVCQGLTTTLTNASPFSGIWTSSNPAIAPVGLTSGVVSGIATGTATVTFTILGTGCYRTTVVSVNPTPDPITGEASVCVGSLTALATTSIGGTWSSSNLTVATVGSGTGIVTGLSSGGATVVYTLPTGCTIATLVVVNPLPDNILGTTEICVGSTSVLTNATPFGTWSSNNVSIASIDAITGSVVAVSPGLATISYTLLATGCYATQQVTVNPVPPVISGNPNLCIGSTTVLTNPLAPGGVWSSSNPAVASIDAFGGLTSVSTGNTTITYTMTSACFTTLLITVEPTLNPLTGPSTVCQLSTITLASDFSGGVWSSTNTSTATVGSTGVVTGVSAGTVDIQYETPLAGCATIKTITVNPLPSAITGTDSACVGTTSILSNLTAGGVWSSADNTIATVSATGLVTAIAADTVTISYTIGTGCTSTLEFRVKPLANAGVIAGLAEVCVDNFITLTNTSSEGVWSSSNTAVGTIDAAGVLTGVGVGTTTISYSAINHCSSDLATFNVLVKPAADAGTLSGTAGLCINYASTITSTVTGGVWTSSNPVVASISASGLVTGLTAGTTDISYAVTTSCGTDIATLTVTVYVMAPHTTISVHPKATLCLNSLYQNFGAEYAPPAGLSYVWSAENAEIYATSPDKQNAIVNFQSPGVAIIRLTTQITNTGCFVRDSFTVTVNADSAHTPEVKYFGNELICTDNTSTSYQWGYDDASNLDSTAIPGAIQQSFYLPVPDFTGKRYWVIAERGGCFQKVYYNKPADVTPLAAGVVDVRLFPNPADSRLNIEVSGINSNEEVSIRLIDMLGKEIETSVLVNGKGSISVAHLPSGIYSVMFINNGMKVASKTFVKN